MNKNKAFSVISAIVFSAVFLLIITEALFNVLGLWTVWNLFGYFIGLLALPILNVVALICAIASAVSFYSYKKTNDNISFARTALLPIIFFVLGLLLTIIAYIFVFTWGFSIY